MDGANAASDAAARTRGAKIPPPSATRGSAAAERRKCRRDWVWFMIQNNQAKRARVKLTPAAGNVAKTKIRHPVTERELKLNRAQRRTNPAHLPNCERCTMFTALVP